MQAFITKRMKNIMLNIFLFKKGLVKEN